MWIERIATWFLGCEDDLECSTGGEEGEQCGSLLLGGKIVSHDLINIEDSSTVLLVKLKDVDAMDNIYTICKNASFLDLSIHHDGEESTAMSEGRVCIATRSQKLISEKRYVEVLGESFKVQVHELGSWGINIFDNSLDTSSHMDINDVVKVADSVEDNSINDLNDLNAKFNELDQDFNDD
uniref:RNA-directed DNA polymerase, eukaryota n=1 Tax=Tanacetum cinerariifolium TaxID=118510 RepID=A0A6L2JTN5_TANCI|nr:RNA-directed DNA polymerase, eukaryota [Tanacetum cinerariifolium]